MVKHTSELEEMALRCEQATGPDRELMIAAYETAFPDGYTQYKSGYNYDRWTRFLKLLDAEAWLDAAMMLAGSVCGLELNKFSPNETERWCCTLATETADGEGEGATPALALCAAALRNQGDTNA